MVWCFNMLKHLAGCRTSSQIFECFRQGVQGVWVKRGEGVMLLIRWRSSVPRAQACCHGYLCLRPAWIRKRPRFLERSWLRRHTRQRERGWGEERSGRRDGWGEGGREVLGHNLGTWWTREKPWREVETAGEGEVWHLNSPNSPFLSWSCCLTWKAGKHTSERQFWIIETHSVRSEEVGLKDHAKVVGNVSPEYIHQDSPLNIMVWQQLLKSKTFLPAKLELSSNSFTNVLLSSNACNTMSPFIALPFV